MDWKNLGSQHGNDNRDPHFLRQRRFHAFYQDGVEGRLGYVVREAGIDTRHQLLTVSPRKRRSEERKGPAPAIPRRATEILLLTELCCSRLREDDNGSDWRVGSVRGLRHCRKVILRTRTATTVRYSLSVEEQRRATRSVAMASGSAYAQSLLASEMKYDTIAVHGLARLRRLGCHCRRWQRLSRKTFGDGWVRVVEWRW